MAMMQSKKLVECKFKDRQLKKIKQKIKRTRRQNRKIGRSNHSIKSKCLKWIVKKILTKIYDMKNARSKIKLMKTGKKLEQRVVYHVKIAPIILNHKK